MFRGLTPCVCFLVGHLYGLMVFLASKQRVMHGGCCCDPCEIGIEKRPPVTMHSKLIAVPGTAPEAG